MKKIEVKFFCPFFYTHDKCVFFKPVVAVFRKGRKYRHFSDNNKKDTTERYDKNNESN